MDRGFSGLKTGITEIAGPCLASYYEKEDVKIIIVSLNSCSMEDRWTEHEQLLNWALENKFWLKR